MLKITREADYGVLVLTCFAKNISKSWLSTKFVSSETKISYRMVCKILNTLTRKGILNSHRGLKGGYQLAKTPDQISLEEALVAFDGPIALTECSKSDCDCVLESTCLVNDHWMKINASFKKSLQNIFLSSLTSSHKNLDVYKEKT